MGIFWVCCFVLPLKCAFRGGVLPWRLLICDPMDRDWGGHPGECGYVTPGAWSSVLWSPWRLWKCDARYWVWEVGSSWRCAHVIPDTGYFRWSHLGNWMSDPRCRVWSEVTLETVDE